MRKMLLVAMLLYIAMPCNTLHAIDTIDPSNITSELFRVMQKMDAKVDQMNEKFNEVNLHLEKLSVQQAEKFERYEDRCRVTLEKTEKNSLNISENRKMINELKNLIIEIRASWKTYLATGGVGAVVATLINILFIKCNSIFNGIGGGD